MPNEESPIFEAFDTLFSAIETATDDNDNDNVKLYSCDTLKTDNKRSGASSNDTVFGVIFTNAATKRIVSLLNEFKLPATLDAMESVNIRVSLDGWVNEVGDMNSTSFTVQVVADFDGLPAAIQ